MSLNKFFVIFLCISCLSLSSFGQGKYVVQNKNGVTKINFKLINNVIIIPVEVNGVNLSFLLDTGVKTPIVFNFIKGSDSLKILNTKSIFIKGLGNNGELEALKSSHNTFKIGDAVNSDQEFFVIFDNSANFAPKLGIPVHGIIGSDFFKDLVVDINYAKKQIKAYNQNAFQYKKCKTCEDFSLQFYNRKPYIDLFANINKKDVPVKLLIDSGNSDAIWLFKNDTLGINLENKYFEDFLGYGLSGNVHGKRSKLEKINFKSFKLKQVKVAFPDDHFIKILRKIKGRNGSVGGEVLKRFNVIFNYRKATVRLKKNRYFKNSFSYNKAGIELENDGVRYATEFERHDQEMSVGNDGIVVKAVYANNKNFVLIKAYKVAQVRTDSPAERIGLQTGDKILRINNVDTSNFSLQEIMNKFFDEEGTKLKLIVERIDIKIPMTLTLESPLK